MQDTEKQDSPDQHRPQPVPSIAECPNNEYLVSWDGPDDPANPYNWASVTKWINVVVICCQAIVSPTLSTMLAIADLQIAADFNLDSIYTPSLPVALFLLGLGIGPLYLAPLSELHGRRVIYVASYIVFTIFNLGTAFASDMKSLSILRFLAGVAGSAGPCLGGSSLGDMFSHKNRGRAQAIYTFGTTNGPLLGGVLGGVLLNATGSWRWLLWIMTIVSGMTTLITILFLKETYGPYLLEQKAKKLRLATGNNAYTAVSGPQITSKARIQNAVVRPFRMLFTVPICSAMACYQSFIVGIYYLHLTTIPLLWGPSEHYDLFSYQWRQDLTGLAYLGGAIGGFVGMIIGAKFYGPSYTWMCKRYGENGIGRPEFRTPFMQLGMLITPFGLFLFGWTAEYHLHWAYPLLGAMIFCCGMLITHISIQTYMVDSFGKYAASALAALVVSRQLVGAVFSMFGFQLYHKLGYGWGTSLLAFICMGMLPIPAVLYIYGPRLRKAYIEK